MQTTLDAVTITSTCAQPRDGSFPEDERLIPTKSVTEALGGISAMQLWRLRQDDFPEPYVQTGGRNFWRVGDVRKWIARRHEVTVRQRQEGG